MKQATLILSDGSRFSGQSFGFDAPASGEVVFNTAMTGYPESLTDPSYAGQLMVLTFPLVGNYGVPPTTTAPNGLSSFMESEKIHANALIVNNYSENFSHWNATQSLAHWLKREQIPGITGIDTRQLTKVLREQGVMMGQLIFDADGSEELNMNSQESDSIAYEAINYVDRVSCKEIIRYLPDGTATQHSVLTSTAQLNNSFLMSSPSLKRVVLVDCGVKSNIIRCLLKRNVEVIRVPWNYDFTSLSFDGLFISNGPGDPDTCDAAVQNIRKAMANPALPIFGICMGNQLLAKAGGAKIYKLKYGHRSHNQPVRMVGTERCFITSQNHGYAVDSNTLTVHWQPLFVNLNDGSNEGLRHKHNPWFSAQFHPEAASGPTDTEFLFDDFVKLLVSHPKINVEQ